MDPVFLFREDSMRGDDFFLKMATRPPLTKLHPQVADFLKTYLQGEKAIPFGERWVINTQFPPWPGRAFDNLVDHFLRDDGRRLYSVTLAVTNRCPFRCWHCYNAGRSPEDIPLAALKRLAARIQDLGAVIVTLTGGEPLLRKDLAEICRGFDDRSCITVGTTGWQLTKKRARELRDSGVFAVGISLDSADRSEHNGMRGRKDAFDIALKGLETAREAGLYPYVVSVGTRDFLERERFMAFMRFVKEAGALEVHLLEPCATGRLAGRKDVALTNAGRQLIRDYQMEISRREDLPVLSTFTYLEGKDAFGCGAGLTHIYIDGSGELCPCNLVPLSFGNITREPLEGILERMGRHFARPRPACVGRTLTPHAGNGPFPVPPDVSERICRDHLPQNHALPRFFRIRKGSLETAGREELAEAYDRVHTSYDDAWVTVAGKAVRDLVERSGAQGVGAGLRGGMRLGLWNGAACRKAPQRGKRDGRRHLGRDAGTGPQADRGPRARSGRFHPAGRRRGPFPHGGDRPDLHDVGARVHRACTLFQGRLACPQARRASCPRRAPGKLAAARVRDLLGTRCARAPRPDEARCLRFSAGRGPSPGSSGTGGA